jgi:hypothetical protein
MQREGFLRRWSRLKGSGNAQAQPPADTDGDSKSSVANSTALPTLEDAMHLTPESDYSTFVAQDVDKAVRRLALKKLFADPHFNQPDGLDIYMGDYNRADPLPEPMLAALRQAQGFLQKQVPAADETMEQAEGQGTVMAAGQGGNRMDAADGSGRPPAESPEGDKA